jgi:hypothetical protein
MSSGGPTKDLSVTEHHILRRGAPDPVWNRETSRADDETAAILRSLIARVRDADRQVRHGATPVRRLRRWLARRALRRALANASDAALDATDHGRD